MIKLVKKQNDFKFFRWFDSSTTEKDINDYVKAKNDPTAFSDKSYLQKMIIDKLAMKMWLISNGKWKNWN